jgi:hypothetical protein
MIRRFSLYIFCTAQAWKRTFLLALLLDIPVGGRHITNRLLNVHGIFVAVCSYLMLHEQVFGSNVNVFTVSMWVESGMRVSALYLVSHSGADDGEGKEA